MRKVTEELRNDSEVYSKDYRLDAAEAHYLCNLVRFSKQLDKLFNKVIRGEVTLGDAAREYNKFVFMEVEDPTRYQDEIRELRSAADICIEDDDEGYGIDDSINEVEEAIDNLQSTLEEIGYSF